jgi:hypothetical protein
MPAAAQAHSPASPLSAHPSPAETAAELAQFGSAVIRDAWPREPLARLRKAIADYCALRAARVQAGQDLGPAEKMYSTHGVGTFAGLMRENLIGVDFLTELFANSRYREICIAHFQDDRFYATWQRLGFRSHDPKLSDRSFIPFHQDSYTQDKRVAKVLNCWIPLDPGAGTTSPGLEVVRHPCRPDFPRKDFGLRSENAAYDFITIDRAAIVEAYGETFMAPEFEVGDSLLFTENVIHRTHVTPAMTEPRINFELRIFSPAHMVPGATLEDLGANAWRIG